MLVTLFAGLFLVVSPGLSFPESEVPNVEPEYLDMLLQTNQYELFSKLMKIDDVDLVRPNDGARSTHPMFNKGLAFGDMLLPKENREEDRQVVRFNVWGGSKWLNGYVPYVISSSFNQEQRNIILKAINSWNEQVATLKFIARLNESDYVLFINGNGCYSYFGRIGGQQPISLQAYGCLWHATILHEMEHAIGIAHEQNRQDRDNFIRILWNNIKENWSSQYDKTNSRDWKDIGSYDYYSIMHYTLESPETDLQAIEIIREDIDEKRIGRGENFTKSDLYKIISLYPEKFD